MSQGELRALRVDAADYWTIVESGGVVDAPKHPTDNTAYGRISFGKWIQFRLHRWIVGVNDPLVDVDHNNGDGLDNRRENLRTATRSENLRNQRKTRGASKYKGVSWHSIGKKWRAAIKRGAASRYLGLFHSEEVAARAYDSAARIHFGEFACPNFPRAGEQSAL